MANLGKPLSDFLIVKVADPSGNGLPGVTVRWSVADYTSGRRRRPNLGMVNPAPAVTDSEGLATGLWTLGHSWDEQTATEQTATASASVSGVGSVSFTATTPSPVPLIDMGASTYFGFPGGLYSGGNVMPQAHADAGQAFAAAIEPLDRNGNPSPNGKYVLLSIGHSNTELIFCGTAQEIPLCPSYSFKGQALADPDVNRTNLAIVRGGCCRGSTEFMQSPNDSDYDRILDRLSTEGLTEQQVQVVWAQPVHAAPNSLPHREARVIQLVRLAGNLLGTFRIRYPNLRLVFLTESGYELALR